VFNYIISIIFLIGNIYCSDVNNIPVSIIINLFIILLFILNGNKIDINIKMGILVLLLLISAGITSHINSNIYYLYIITRNATFIATLIFIYQNIDFKIFSKLALLAFLLNNIISLGILLNIQPIISFSEYYTNLFNISMRFDYRLSGIISGTLMASLLSCYAFIYTLYYIKSNLVKIPLSISLMLFMFIQSRSAIVLAIFSWLLYIFNNMLYKESKHNIRNLFVSIILVGSCVLLIYNNVSYFNNYIPYLSSTIEWQKTGLTELNNSSSMMGLMSANSLELNKHLNNSNILGIFFGNGMGNWKGANSIETDTGFVVQFIGLGIIGCTILLIIYLTILKNILKSFMSIRFILLITIFIIQIYMNYKSTSFIGYNYFNIFFIFYTIVLKKEILFKNKKL
jgi:hypothetical protein